MEALIQIRLSEGGQILNGKRKEEKGQDQGGVNGG